MLATRRSLLLAAAVLAPGRAQAFYWDTEPEPPKAPVPIDPASNRDAWFTGAIPDDPFDVPTVDLTLVPPEFRKQLVKLRRAGARRHAGHRYARPLPLPRARGSDRDPLRHRGGPGWLHLVRHRRDQAQGQVAGLAPDGGHAEASARHPTLRRAWRREPARVPRPLPLPRRQGTRSTASTAPTSLGRWAARIPSGCIRLLNEDIYDLYGRVPTGTTVVVKTSMPEAMVQREWDDHPRSDNQVLLFR